LVDGVLVGVDDVDELHRRAVQPGLTLPWGETPDSSRNEEKSVNDLLSIGQFSRMAWLSIKALRLYDESGLLEPAHIDPATGYRYYRADQALVARAIAILRSLDMPLSEIGEVVTESDPDKVRARLHAHRTVLEDRLDRHVQMLARVEGFIRKGAVVTYDISIKSYEPVDVVGLTLTTQPEAIGAETSSAFGRIFGALGSAGIEPAGLPRLVYRAVDEDPWAIEACVPVSGVSETPGGLTMRRFEGGRAASTVHVGPYEELGLAYREVEAWINERGLETAGFPFDVYRNDPDEVEDPLRFETEVYWPVR
jgi:DNA-binding transcriptional MerR regulator